jgi:hypothetical protein
MELSSTRVANGCAATRELSSILWNSKVHYHIHKSSPHILFWARPILLIPHNLLMTTGMQKEATVIPRQPWFLSVAHFKYQRVFHSYTVHQPCCSILSLRFLFVYTQKTSVKCALYLISDTSFVASKLPPSFVFLWDLFILQVKFILKPTVSYDIVCVSWRNEKHLLYEY